jgi:hypothetical protein
MALCSRYNSTDELGSDFLPSMIDGDIEMPNPTHGRITGVRVTIQPAHTDDSSIVGGDEEGFPWLVKTV